MNKDRAYHESWHCISIPILMNSQPNQMNSSKTQPKEERLQFKNQQKTTRIIKDFKMYYNFEYCAPLLLHHWKHYSRPMSLVLILYTSMLMVCPNSSGTQSFNTHLLTGASLSISRLSYCRSRPSPWFYHFHTHVHLLILI